MDKKVVALGAVGAGLLGLLLLSRPQLGYAPGGVRIKASILASTPDGAKTLADPLLTPDGRLLTDDFKPIQRMTLSVIIRVTSGFPHPTVSLRVLVDGKMAASRSLGTIPPGVEKVVNLPLDLSLFKSVGTHVVRVDAEASNPVGRSTASTKLSVSVRAAAPPKVTVSARLPIKVREGQWMGAERLGARRRVFQATLHLPPQARLRHL